MRPLFDECVQTLIANLNDAISYKQGVVDMKTYLGCFSLDVIASTAFGAKLDSMRDPNNAIASQMKRFFGNNISLKSLIVLFFPQLMKYLNLYIFNYEVLCFLSKLTQQLIEERKQLIKKKAPLPRDVIQLLLDAKRENSQKSINSHENLSDDEIADQIMLFMVAGYDTSSSALSSIVYCLAKHQQCQVLRSDSDRCNDLYTSVLFTAQIAQRVARVFEQPSKWPC